MSDLLEFAGLVVLSALEEVEQDDVAQHRALGAAALGWGSPVLWSTPGSPRSQAPVTPRLCCAPTAMAFPPFALGGVSTPGLGTSPTHHTDGGESGHRVDEGGDDAELPCLGEQSLLAGVPHLVGQSP